MTDTLQHPEILHTQVPLFRGNREKYNEFEHLLLNHLKPHQHKLSEEQKLTYFQSLLRDDAIEFWQSVKITTQTTLTQVLRFFKKEYAKEDLKEVAKYKFDQMRYDPIAESSCLPNFPFRCKMNWQLQESMMLRWSKSGHLCNADVSMHISFQQILAHNHSTR